jgi:cobalt-zinc-cadmium efflux system outer membrane protein
MRTRVRSAAAVGLCMTAMATAVVRRPYAAEALHLDDALARGRSRNATLEGARADVVSARGRLDQAGVLAANPVFTSGLTHHRIPGDTNLEPHVSLGQELEIGGQRGLRIDAARNDVERAEQRRADRERLVDGEVRRAFAGLVAAERLLAIASEAARQSTHLATATATRVEQGDAGRIDLDLTRLDEVKTREDAAAAELAVRRARARLALAIGADPDEPLAVVPPPDAGVEPPAEAAALERALAARPDLAAARAERARLDGQAALVHRAGIVPNPKIRGYYSHENGNEDLVGGEVEVPLPIFDRQQGTETDLRGQAAAAAAEVVRLERTIPREVRLALARYAAATAAARRYAEDAGPATASANASLDRARRAGQLSVIDVLTQQDRLREARRAAVGAWLEVHEAEADLVEAVGGIPW